MTESSRRGACPSVDGDAPRGSQPLRSGLILIRSIVGGWKLRSTGRNPRLTVRCGSALTVAVPGCWCQTLVSGITPSLDKPVLSPNAAASPVWEVAGTATISTDFVDLVFH